MVLTFRDLKQANFSLPNLLSELVRREIVPELQPQSIADIKAMVSGLGRRLPRFAKKRRQFVSVTQKFLRLERVRLTAMRAAKSRPLEKAAQKEKARLVAELTQKQTEAEEAKRTLETMGRLIAEMETVPELKRFFNCVQKVLGASITEQERVGAETEKTLTNLQYKTAGDLAGEEDEKRQRAITACEEKCLAELQKIRELEAAYAAAKRLLQSRLEERKKLKLLAEKYFSSQQNLSLVAHSLKNLARNQ